MRREDLEHDFYDQLRQRAGRLMRGERLDHTLTATGLVHEAYLRLGNSFANPAHFYAAAAEAMRRVLVDAARARQRLKRGGADAVRVDLGDVPAPVSDDRLIALDAALTALAQRDPAAAEVVALHHFAGLSHEKVADTRGVTVHEARRLWTFARAWLKTELGEFSPTAPTDDDA